MKHRMNRMQKLREKMGLSQTEVANKLSLRPSTYWDYEKSEREPRYEILIKIADFFDVSLDYLLEREFSETGKSISTEEWEMLKKYQFLSPKSQELIRLIINFESENSKQNISKITREQNLILVKKASRDGGAIQEEFMTEEQLHEIQNCDPMDDDL